MQYDEAEYEDDPEPEPVWAWQSYDLTTLPDGTIEGRTITNDNNDDIQAAIYLLAWWLIRGGW